MVENAIEFQKVTYFYPQAKKPSLTDVSLTIEQGKFVLLMGATGSGKSTIIKLARGLSAEYGGTLTGLIRIEGEELNSRSAYDLGNKVGIVFQNPSYQLHQPRVIDEIMSAPMYQGLPWTECLERAQSSARGVVEEVLLPLNPQELSAGQQQKVAVAASLSMKAKTLLLDEPFSYLDSKSQVDFVQILKSLKSKGYTIVLATHDLEPVAKIVDQIILISDGQVIEHGEIDTILYGKNFIEFFGQPLWARVGEELLKNNRNIALPTSMEDVIKILRLEDYIPPPSRITSIEHDTILNSLENEVCSIKLSNVTFGYSQNVPILKGLSLSVKKGEVLGIIGGNGSGKTTLALILLGLLKANKGVIEILGKKIEDIYAMARVIGYVAQDPRNMLFETSVYNECLFGPKALGLENPERVVNVMLERFRLLGNAERDPLSLSGGEQRLLTFAAVLVNQPEIMILDEPEFGLDPTTWEIVAVAIRELKALGKTVVLITHRLEATLFLCDRLAVLAHGKILSVGKKIDIIGNDDLLSSASMSYEALSKLFSFLRALGKDPVNEADFIHTLITNTYGITKSNMK